MLDNARILYNKGLYIQSLKTLEKTKELALTHQQNNVVQQVLFFEKKIEALFITRSMQNRAESLIQESTNCVQNLESKSQLRTYRYNCIVGSFSMDLQETRQT